MSQRGKVWFLGKLEMLFRSMGEISEGDDLLMTSTSFVHLKNHFLAHSKREITHDS